MKNHANSVQTPLTDEQWAGLARIGDLGARLGQVLDGPSAEVFTGGIDRVGRLASRYDVMGLAESLIATLDQLERAGLLAMVRENAQFVGASAETLLPLLSRWLQQLAALPVEEIKADVENLFSLLRKLRTVGDFMEKRLAGDITAGAVSVSEFLRANHTDEAIADLLVLLGRLQRSGLLANAGQWADSAAAWFNDQANISSGKSFVPLLSKWLEQLAELPLDEIKTDVEALFILLRKLRSVTEFIDTHLAGELTAGAVNVAEFVHANATDKAVSELLIVLGQLHRSGLLADAGRWAEQLAGITDGMDVAASTSQLMNKVPGQSLEQLRQLIHSAQDAVADVQRDGKDLGGITGLMRLLRDKDVQKGLRLLAVLPAEIGRRMENGKHHMN